MYVLQRSVLAEKLIFLEGKPFSLDDYAPFRSVYDCGSQVIALVTGRQVGKCLILLSNITMEDGSLRQAKDIKVGDRVQALDNETKKIVAATIEDVIPAGKKPCLKITTSLGNTLTVATTHPIRTLFDWTPAELLDVGNSVAAVLPGTKVGSGFVWDSIVHIENVGEHECVDFCVAQYHNFIADGVVTHNSTSLANFLLTGGLAIPQFRSLFISPSKEQTSRFSNTRFAKALFFSPMIKRHFVSTAMPANNVTLRMLANGSEFFFSYAVDNADRIRGISSDLVCYDEVQNLILEAIDPVIRECLSASKYKLRMYCGTPLSEENDIELLLWQKSTQNEWVVQCKACGGHNVLGIKNIGPKCIICSNPKCEKPIDVGLGRWFITRPSATIAGFRIPQIALRGNVDNKVAYDSLLEKQRDYSKAQFNNEVLGLSDSLGARLIGVQHLKALCKDYHWTEGRINPVTMRSVGQTVAGVDWGGQSPTNVSRTALAIQGILPDGRLRLLYGKIFPVGHAIQDLQEIIAACQLFGVRCVVGDSGEGMLANAQLRQALGFHRVYGSRYAGQNGKLIWNRNNNDPGYHCDRTMLLDQVMNSIITHNYELPSWQQFEPFSDDLLALYEETGTNNRRAWRHAATRPDDFAHALAFSWLASKIANGTVVMYQDRDVTDDP